MNFLYSDLVHSKIGLALESRQKMDENRALTRLHALAGELPRAGTLTYARTSRAGHTRGQCRQHAGRGVFRTPTEVDFSNFLGVTRVVQGLVVGYGLDRGSSGCFTEHVSGFGSSFWVICTDCSTRVLPSPRPFVRCGLPEFIQFLDSGQILHQPIFFGFFYLPIYNSN